MVERMAERPSIRHRSSSVCEIREPKLEKVTVVRVPGTTRGMGWLPRRRGGVLGRYQYFPPRRLE